MQQETAPVLGRSSGDTLIYLCEPRPWTNKIVAIAHNAKAIGFHFIKNRSILIKWKTDLIVNGIKIVRMIMEHLALLDSVSFHPCSLRKLPESFGLEANKSWYHTILISRKT